jgi:FtsZ-interacting cell division protein ZipA
MNTRVLDSNIWGQPWFIMVMLVIIFGVIVLGVWLVRKYVPAFKSDEKPKSDKEIAEEEVRRMTRPVDDETAKKMEEQSKALEKDSTIDETEKKDDTIERSTRPIEDDSVAKQMEEYAKAHPEEEEAAAKKKEDK